MLAWPSPHLPVSQAHTFSAPLQVVKVKIYTYSIVLEKTDLHDRSNPNKINKLANYFRMAL
jgi:hypothetical protein